MQTTQNFPSGLYGSKHLIQRGTGVEWLEGTKEEPSRLEGMLGSMADFPRSGLEGEDSWLLLVRRIADGWAVVWSGVLPGEDLRRSERQRTIVLPSPALWPFLPPAAERLRSLDDATLIHSREQVLESDPLRALARGVVDLLLGLAVLSDDEAEEDSIVCPPRVISFDELVTLAALYAQFLRPGASVAVLPRHPGKTTLAGQFWHKKKGPGWDLMLAPASPARGDYPEGPHPTRVIEPVRGSIRGLSLEDLAGLPGESFDELFADWPNRAADPRDDPAWGKRLRLPLARLNPAIMTKAEFADWLVALDEPEMRNARFETADRVAEANRIDRLVALAEREQDRPGESCATNHLLERLGLTGDELEALIEVEAE